MEFLYFLVPKESTNNNGMSVDVGGHMLLPLLLLGIVWVQTIPATAGL